MYVTWLMMIDIIKINMEFSQTLCQSSKFVGVSAPVVHTIKNSVDNNVE